MQVRVTIPKNLVMAMMKMYARALGLGLTMKRFDGVLDRNRGLTMKRHEKVLDRNQGLTTKKLEKALGKKIQTKPKEILKQNPKETMLHFRFQIPTKSLLLPAHHLVKLVKNMIFLFYASSALGKLTSNFHSKWRFHPC
jgi:hypothetical protein